MVRVATSLNIHLFIHVHVLRHSTILFRRFDFRTTIAGRGREWRKRTMVVVVDARLWIRLKNFETFNDIIKILFRTHWTSSTICMLAATQMLLHVPITIAYCLVASCARAEHVWVLEHVVQSLAECPFQCHLRQNIVYKSARTIQIHNVTASDWLFLSSSFRRSTTTASASQNSKLTTAWEIVSMGLGLMPLVISPLLPSSIDDNRKMNWMNAENENNGKSVSSPLWTSASNR